MYVDVQLFRQRWDVDPCVGANKLNQNLSANVTQKIYNEVNALKVN